MGFLIDIGEFLTYAETKDHQKYIKEQGILQFLNLLKKFKDHKNIEDLNWGYEVEAHVVTSQEGKVKFYGDFHQKTKGTKVQDLNAKLKHTEITKEYGAWMIEFIPKEPTTLNVSPVTVLNTMKQTSKEARDVALDPGQYILTLPTFPKNGVGDYFYAPETIAEHHIKPEDIRNKTYNKFSQSSYFDDLLICNHPRFSALTKVIRERKGKKVSINVPVFQDKRTPKTYSDEPVPGFIHMDAMGFGMGNCCFQMTFSGRDMSHTRHLYDMLGILSPFAIVLTAGSPFFKGKISDYDGRWPVIAASVDDRTDEELDETNPKYIPKSRYDSISYFISNGRLMKDEYNDLKFPLNHEIMEFLRVNSKSQSLDLDERMITHFGFLYMRDPLVVFKDKIEVTDPTSTAHFESIQSTNWNSVRFKPPPKLTDTKIGWRVEFRTPEIGLTDIENSAISSLVRMFIQMVSYERVKFNFYIPVTKLDENFKKSYLRNAINEQKFIVRKNVIEKHSGHGEEEKGSLYTEVTMKEFFYGKTDFPGFLALYKAYINMLIEDDPSQKEKLPLTHDEYMESIDIILKRAKNEVPTVATWMREIVQRHPKYNHDSILSEEVMDDLLQRAIHISENNAIKEYTTLPQYPHF